MSASDSHPQPKSPTRVTPQTISKAVTSLLQWNQSKSPSEKPQLLPQEQFFYLILTLKQIPQESIRTNPYKIPLPHPLVQDSEVCLIIDDRPKSKLTLKAAEKKLKSDNVSVSKVLGFSKLKSDYKPFDFKKKLCDSYDMFFADKGLVTFMPKLLGKTFFKKKKLPLRIDLSHNNWKEQIERGCSSALLHIKSGTCSNVKVGRVSMEKDEIVENVVEGIEGIVRFVPNMWEGVRSLHLKLLDSMALPLYQSVPDVLLKIEGVKEVVDSEVEVKEDKMKEGKSGKKNKGRIDVDGDDNESEKRKRRKKVGLVKERVSGEEVVEELGKKTKKARKGGRIDADIKNDNAELGKEDLASEEVETKKKKKKGNVKEGLVISEKNLEKPAKKTKKGVDKEQEMPLESTEELAGKKGKKKVKVSKK